MIEQIEQEQEALAREIKELARELQGYLIEISHAVNALREKVALELPGKGYIN